MEKTYTTIFVARQPVFDAQDKLWGYHLLYRDNGLAQRAEFNDALEATLKVMACNCVQPTDKIAPGKVLVNFPEESILVNAPMALPPENSVAIVENSPAPRRFYLEAISQLKEAGFQIALKYLSPEEHAPELLALCDIIILDFENGNSAAFQSHHARTARNGVKILARRVETEQQYELAGSLGCQLFQGFYFQRPSNLKMRTLSASEASKLRLFQVIKSQTPDFDALTEGIETDVSICYRLLAMLNSPAFSFVREITSVRQAVLMLGWRQIQNWLRLIILTDLPASEKALTLARIAVQRARFMELCAPLATQPEDDEALFLLGLFSLLDAMLDTPMEEVLRHLALEAELCGALHGERNRFSPWMKLVSALESGDWPQVDLLASRLGLPAGELANLQQQAIDWVNSFCSAMQC